MKDERPPLTLSKEESNEISKMPPDDVQKLIAGMLLEIFYLLSDRLPPKPLLSLAERNKKVFDKIMAEEDALNKMRERFVPKVTPQGEEE